MSADQDPVAGDQADRGSVRCQKYKVSSVLPYLVTATARASRQVRMLRVSSFVVDEVGEVLLRGGSHDGDVLSAMPLNDSIAVPSERGTDLYVRTGAYQQLRGVKLAEPYLRFWIYEYVDSPH